GGADIASLAHRLIVIMPHDKRRLRASVDFVTSPGYGRGGDWRKRVGLPGGGPSVLITTLGVFRFADGSAVLESFHPGTSVERIRAETGWALSVAAPCRARRGHRSCGLGRRGSSSGHGRDHELAF